MRLDITKSVVLPVPPDVAWAFVREPAQVADCVPNLTEFASIAPDRYTSLLVERLGPFSVRIPLEIGVTQDAGARQVVARISGVDRGGAARVRGDVRASITPDAGGARLDVVSAVEVLGRMAALGAVPMRRRGDQVFDQFVRTVEQRLGGSA